MDKKEFEKTKKEVVFLGAKFGDITFINKSILYISLVMFCYYIVKINNRTITTNDYKLYFIFGIIIFVMFSLDTFLNYLVDKKIMKEKIE